MTEIHTSCYVHGGMAAWRSVTVWPRYPGPATAVRGHVAVAWRAGGWNNGQSLSIYTDIDECLTNNGGCNQTCNNSPGSFSCSCRDGYSQNSASCIDIDECSNNNGYCNQTCNNSPGSFSCSCRDGYSQTGASCMDIDECTTDNDIDECDTNNGGCAQHCTNTQGSYSCSCDDGYLFNGMECNDIDECRDSPCEQSCHNVDGGFHCYCEPGWVIMEDNVTCAVSESTRRVFWTCSVIGLLATVVIPMAVVYVWLRCRRVCTNDANNTASTSRRLHPHPGSERAVPTSPAAVSREDGPTDPEVSAAPADSQYENIKIYTNSEAAQGVYEKVA